MNDKNKEFDIVSKLVKALRNMYLFVVFLVVLGYVAMSNFSSVAAEIEEAPSRVKAKTLSAKKEKKDFFSQKYSVEELGDSPLEQSIKQGYQLVTNTHKLIGPLSEDPTKRYTGNMLTCNNCHLNAGTKKYAAPYIGVTGKFPKYIGRENKVESLEERINGCMERSMNGKKLSHESDEMHAFVAYMNWLSRNVAIGENIEGQGFKPIELPHRKVDLSHGEKVYQQSCSSCHGTDASGMQNPDGTFTFPPLAGDKTYNQGAGMHRVLTSAKFIKHNMPLGASAENPILSDEEAYDVAGYINSLSRPEKEGVAQDFPDLKRKPVSTPYGPWEDDFPAQQHKYGPFQEIIAYYEKEYNIHKTK